MNQNTCFKLILWNVSQSMSLSPVPMRLAIQGCCSHSTASSSNMFSSWARPGMKWIFSFKLAWSVFGRSVDFVFCIIGRRTFPVTHIPPVTSHLRNEKQQMKGRTTLPSSSVPLPRNIFVIVENNVNRPHLIQISPRSLQNTAVKPLMVPLDLERDDLGRVGPTNREIMCHSSQNTKAKP